MGAKTKFSASEAAEAMTYMGMAGWKAGDMIDGIGGVMHLAAASGEDLATTSDIVTDALTAFGLTAADSGRFADVLAAASTNANTNVGMMGDTFRYVAPIAGAMGYSAEDTAVAIGLMANSGIKATQAGTALRAIITRMAKPTKESAAAMDALGISVTDSSGQMKPLNEIIGDMRAGFSGLTESEMASYAAMLAGQEAMSGLLAIAEAAPSDVEKLTAAIYGCNGAAEEMSATMIDNLQGDLTLLGSAFESLQIAVSDALTPTLRAFAQFGQQAMSSLLEGFQGGGTEGFFDALTGVVTQAAAFLAEQAPQFAEVSMRLMQSMADGILNARDKITDSANQIFGMLVSGLDSWLGTHVSELVDFGRQIVQSLFQGFLSAGEMISTYIGEFVPLIAEAFLQYHEALFTVGIEILGAIGRGIAENKEQIAHIASETIAHLVDSLRDNADGIIEGALALLDALASGILDNLPRIVEAGAEIVAKLIAGMSGNLPAVAVVVGAVTTEVLKVTKAAGDIGRAFGSLGSLIGRDGANIQGVVSSIGGAFTTMGALAGKAVAALTGGLQALWAAMLANPITAVVAVVGALVVPDNLIWIEGGYAGVVEYVRLGAGLTGAVLTAKGRCLAGLLDRRILWGRYELAGTVQEIMRRLVADCCVTPTRGGDPAGRVIPGLALAAPEGGGGPDIRIQRTGGSLLEALEALGEAYQVAFGVRFDPAVPRMEFWTRPCADRTVGQTANEPVLYSTELDDVLESEYTYDSGGWRNLALVAGAGEGDGRTMVTVTGAGGDGEVRRPDASGVVGRGVVGTAVTGKEGAA